MRPSIQLIVLGAVLGIGASAQAQRSEWRLADTTVVRFECEGPQISEAARGRFSAVSGRLSADPSNLVAVRGNVEVTLASITTDRVGWDAMFRNAPFLAIDEHPRSRFELRRVTGARALTPGSWASVQLEGRFSVHGVTRDTTLPARMRWVRPSDGSPERLEVRASFPLRWTDHRIRVPDGRTRHFAGDLARVHVQIVYHRT